MPRGESTKPTADARLRSEGLWLILSSESGVRAMPMPEMPRVVIGRGSECDVIIEDDSVSRRHAILHDRELEDLGSRNGTTVGDRRLAKGERVGLEIGMIVEVGSATLMLHRGPPVAVERRRSAVPVRLDSDERSPVLLDPKMQRLYAMLDVVAASMLTILVLGETGTGKEVFAAQAHARSPRRAEPFLRINCAVLTGSLLESELFGHERGAFTGAVQAKQGLFESAEGGTVFLDEVGELPLDTQARLLRVLENGEVMRLGSVKPRRVDVRWVSATNRDLVSAAKAGLFRSDLYYRLNGVTVTLPPLRRRTAEILPLAEHFIALAAASAGRPAPRLAPAARELLIRNRWPGNVRELKNVIDRGVVLAAGATVIGLEHLLLSEPDGPTSVPSARSGSLVLPSSSRGAVGPALLVPRRQPIERELIFEALQRTGGNQTEAAKLLSVSRRTLINKMEKLGVARPRKR